MVESSEENSWKFADFLQYLVDLFQLISCYRPSLIFECFLQLLETLLAVTVRKLFKDHERKILFSFPIVVLKPLP